MAIIIYHAKMNDLMFNLFNIKATTQEVYDMMAKGVVTSAMEGIHGEG